MSRSDALLVALWFTAVTALALNHGTLAVLLFVAGLIVGIAGDSREQRRRATHARDQRLLEEVRRHGQP